MKPATTQSHKQRARDYSPVDEVGHSSVKPKELLSSSSVSSQASDQATHSKEGLLSRIWKCIVKAFRELISCFGCCRSKQQEKPVDNLSIEKRNDPTRTVE